MLLNIKKFLEETGIVDAFYPGKRLVKKCKVSGEHKSHSVVMDWRDPDKVRVELKAGLSGRTLEPKELKKYPVSLQTPTYIEIEVNNDNTSDDEGEEEEGKSSGGKGGGGKKPAKKKSLEDIEVIAARFGDSAEGQIPEEGTITEMVVMGMQIAQEAYESVMSVLTQQMKQSVVHATELLAKASSMVTRVQPPSFLEPKGNETEKYKYDREKNADIGFRPSFG